MNTTSTAAFAPNTNAPSFFTPTVMIAGGVIGGVIGMLAFGGIFYAVWKCSLKAPVKVKPSGWSGRTRTADTMTGKDAAPPPPATAVVFVPGSDTTVTTNAEVAETLSRKVTLARLRTAARLVAQQQGSMTPMEGGGAGAGTGAGTGVGDADNRPKAERIRDAAVMLLLEKKRSAATSSQMNIRRLQTGEGMEELRKASAADVGSSRRGDNTAAIAATSGGAGSGTAANPEMAAVQSLLNRRATRKASMLAAAAAERERSGTTGSGSASGSQAYGRRQSIGSMAGSGGGTADSASVVPISPDSSVSLSVPGSRGSTGLSAAGSFTQQAPASRSASRSSISRRGTMRSSITGGAGGLLGLIGGGDATVVPVLGSDIVELPSGGGSSNSTGGGGTGGGSAAGGGLVRRKSLLAVVASQLQENQPELQRMRSHQPHYGDSGASVSIDTGISPMHGTTLNPMGASPAAGGASLLSPTPSRYSLKARATGATPSSGALGGIDVTDSGATSGTGLSRGRSVYAGGGNAGGRSNSNGPAALLSPMSTPARATVASASMATPSGIGIRVDTGDIGSAMRQSSALRSVEVDSNLGRSPSFSVPREERSNSRSRGSYMTPATGYAGYAGGGGDSGAGGSMDYTSESRVSNASAASSASAARTLPQSQSFLRTSALGSAGVEITRSSGMGSSGGGASTGAAPVRRLPTVQQMHGAAGRSNNNDALSNDLVASLFQGAGAS